MNFLLKAKSWQLALGINLFPILIFLYWLPSFITPKLQKSRVEMPDSLFVLLSMVLFLLVPALLVFVWQYSVAMGLQRYLPAGAGSNVNRFKALQLCVVIGLLLSVMWGIFLWYHPASGIKSVGIPLIGLLLAFVLFCGIHNFSFVSKTVRSIELGREAKLSEYISYFWLFSFSFLGYRSMQPKINQIVANNPLNVQSSDTKGQPEGIS